MCIPPIAPFNSTFKWFAWFDLALYSAALIGVGRRGGFYPHKVVPTIWHSWHFPIFLLLFTRCVVQYLCLLVKSSEDLSWSRGSSLSCFADCSCCALQLSRSGSLAVMIISIFLGLFSLPCCSPTTKYWGVVRIWDTLLSDGLLPLMPSPLWFCRRD